MIELVRKKKLKEPLCFTLDDKSIDTLDELSSLSGLKRSQVVRNFIGLFGDIYRDLIELQKKYDKQKIYKEMSFDDYLVQNGYGFLVEGKCK